jgi:glycogen(starch) synthase
MPDPLRQRRSEVRIVHLTWEYPPVVHGGLGRYVDAVSRAQAAAGHDVLVIAPADDLTDAQAHPAAAREVHDGVRVERVRLRGHAEPSADLLTAMSVLQSRMASAATDVAEVDVVHAHDWMVADAGRAIAAGARRPLVLTLHATEHGRRFGRLDDALHRRVHEAERRAVATADRVVVCSPAMRHEAVAHGARPDRVHVVPAGVDAERWQVGAADRDHARERWAGAAQHLVVAAGRLEWEKGFSTLLRAVPAVLQRQPSTQVVIAGQGSYEPVLRRLADELGVTPHLTLPGRLGSRELAALLGAADAVVVPSRYEPFGLVALEAQAAGAPVVVTRTGGLGDLVVDGRTGRVVAPGDVDRLAQVLVELGADDALRDRLRRAGQAHARTRTWQDVARRLERVYAGALTGR